MIIEFADFGGESVEVGREEREAVFLEEAVEAGRGLSKGANFGFVEVSEVKVAPFVVGEIEEEGSVGPPFIF